MSIESTRAVVERYLADHSADALDQEVVFTLIGSGQQFRGPQAVEEMLDGFYHGLFEARAERRSLLVGDGHAVLEADVVGQLRQPLGDIEPSDDEVRVPLCVVYEVEGEAIVAGRVYLETDRLRQP
jgi:limonene-1,2-epoxide hydrolase